jgi:hypothetical protein
MHNDTAYMHVSRFPAPLPVRVSSSNGRKPTPATAMVEHSRKIVAQIHEYRRLREAAAPGHRGEDFDLGRLFALEARLIDEGAAVRFPCNLVTWLRVDGGTRCPCIAVVRCISATRVTLAAHPGLEPGHRVRLTFPMGKHGQPHRLTLVARVVRVQEDRVELELDDDGPADPIAQAA